MLVKKIVDEWYQDYKKPSMFIAFPSCNFKCDKECGKRVCQNSTLATTPNIMIDTEKLCERYLSNPITQAIVCGGLEPFDSCDNLSWLLYLLRDKYKCNDDFVVFTGYTEREVNDWFSRFVICSKVKGNVIIKYGRYMPNQKPHYDEVLGVELASDNQYGKRIS